MKIVYAGPSRAVVCENIVCTIGEPVSFPDATAKALLEQGGWMTPREYAEHTTEPDAGRDHEERG